MEYTWIYLSIHTPCSQWFSLDLWMQINLEALKDLASPVIWITAKRGDYRDVENVRGWHSNLFLCLQRTAHVERGQWLQRSHSLQILTDDEWRSGAAKIYIYNIYTYVRIYIYMCVCVFFFICKLQLSDLIHWKASTVSGKKRSSCSQASRKISEANSANWLHLSNPWRLELIAVEMVSL